jgi:hypothetical protein
LLRGILEDVQKPALERLRILVHAFIRSECDEAKVRGALNDAAPLYRDAPEAHEARASGERTVQIFMREALPEASEAISCIGRQPDHHDAERGGEAFFGKSSNPRRDRSLRRGHGRYVLRLP